MKKEMRQILKDDFNEAYNFIVDCSDNENTFDKLERIKELYMYLLDENKMQKEYYRELLHEKDQEILKYKDSENRVKDLCSYLEDKNIKYESISKLDKYRYIYEMNKGADNYIVIPMWIIKNKETRTEKYRKRREQCKRSY